MAKNKGGRPPTYSEEEQDEIIAYVLVQVASGRFVSRVFREDATTANGIKMPAESTFWLWLYQDDSGKLSEKLAHARIAGVEALLDETIDIADETQFDTIQSRDEEGNITNEKPNKEWMMRSKLRVETRFKLAQMMSKKYRPGLDLTSNGQPLDRAVEIIKANKKRLEEYDGGKDGIEE